MFMLEKCSSLRHLANSERSISLEGCETSRDQVQVGSMASVLLRSTSSLVRRTPLLASLRASSHGPSVDPQKGKVGEYFSDHEPPYIVRYSP